jgi:hypothetical protein
MKHIDVELMLPSPLFDRSLILSLTAFFSTLISQDYVAIQLALNLGRGDRSAVLLPGLHRTYSAAESSLNNMPPPPAYPSYKGSVLDLYS